MKGELAGATAIFCMLLGSSYGTSEASNQVNIFPPEARPYGLTYEDHLKNFTSWIYSIPADTNPTSDKSGERCSNGQTNSSSPVFYLSGGGGGKHERTCNIPAGKSVFIPVMNGVLSQKESPTSSIQGLHDSTKKDQDSVVSLSLNINGTTYDKSSLDRFRVHTDDFEVLLPKNAIFGQSEGPTRVVSDGYNVITEPLQKGTYTIHFSGSLLCAGANCISPSFAEDIRYTLIVE